MKTLNWKSHSEKKGGWTSYDLIAETEGGNYEIAHADDGYYLYFKNQNLIHKKSLEEIKSIAQAHNLLLEENLL